MRKQRILIDNNNNKKKNYKAFYSKYKIKETSQFAYSCKNK